jgi:NAD(P)-dependent dehydrogenase (short-subunit alcohol dehydrogenase family)
VSRTRSLEGQVAVVTGAARGIGRAAAVALAEAGASVHGIDRLPIASPVRAWPTDLRDAALVAETMAAIEAAAGRIDILVNNAGVIALAEVEDMAVETFDLIHAVNLRAAFLTVRAAVPGMKKRRQGSIINVSSNAGVRGRRLESVYTASKHGLEGFSLALADELSPFGIAVNTLAPGHPVRTAMSETTYGPAERAAWIDPAALGPAFVHLAAQNAGGTTGKHIRAWDLVQELGLVPANG